MFVPLRSASNQERCWSVIGGLLRARQQSRDHLFHCGSGFSVVMRIWVGSPLDEGKRLAIFVTEKGGNQLPI